MAYKNPNQWTDACHYSPQGICGSLQLPDKCTCDTCGCNLQNGCLSHSYISLKCVSEQYNMWIGAAVFNSLSCSWMQMGLSHHESNSSILIANTGAPTGKFCRFSKCCQKQTFYDCISLILQPVEQASFPAHSIHKFASSRVGLSASSLPNP